MKALFLLFVISQVSVAGIKEECGSGPLLCPDGACVRMPSSCQHLTCPDPLPHLCPDGTCAEEVSHCVVAQEVCPVERPVRWHDGSCRSKEYSPDCPHPGVWDGETCHGSGLSLR